MSYTKHDRIVSGAEIYASDIKDMDNKIYDHDSDISDLQDSVDVLEPTASASDVGKALKVKTVAGGKVTTYEFGETAIIDSTLTEAGKAADAKKTGDEITGLKSALTFSSRYSGIEQITVLRTGGTYEPLALTKGDQLIVTNGNGEAFSSFRINCYDSSKHQIDFFTFNSSTSNPRVIMWNKTTDVAYVGLLDDSNEAIIVYKSEYDSLGERFDNLESEITKYDIGSWNGFVFPDAERIYQFGQLALNTDVIDLKQFFVFNANYSITSDGEYVALSGYYATEEYYKVPVSIYIKSPSGLSVNAYRYNADKTYANQSYTISSNSSGEIPYVENTFLRFSASANPENVGIVVNVNGLVFNEIDTKLGRITNGMKLSSVGNQITARNVGYVSKAGVQDATATSYNYSNKIPVNPGETISFWRTDSDAVVGLQCRFLCAYNSEGTAVSAKGAEYVRAYTVPDGIYSIVISFGSSITNAMAIFGIEMPSQYISTKKDLYAATAEFAEEQETMFLQKQRSNDELKEGVLYYLDQKSAVCYCKPQNLATAKINIYFNGNESTAGSSACFVDFANGTFGFYRGFGIYNSSSLVVEKSENMSIIPNTDHEYCIEYKRYSAAPYSLKVTDMMTLEYSEITTTNNVNGWGMIGYDATAVTINGFKRLTGLPKNPTVLILGDSYTEGGTIWSDRDKRWCYLLGEAIGNFAINGQGGARSDHILSWIDNYMFDVFNPKYIIIETGTNEQATAYFTRNLTDIITKVKAIGAQPILCTVPVTTVKTNPSDYNTFVLNSGLPFIDICRALTVNGDRATQKLDYFLTDKIHPNIEGHQRIFEMAKLNVPELFRNVSL